MNIHEYQAKSVLKKFKVPVSEGVLVTGSSDGLTFRSSTDVGNDAVAAAEKLKKEVKKSFHRIKK